MTHTYTYNKEVEFPEGVHTGNLAADIRHNDGIAKSLSNAAGLVSVDYVAQTVSVHFAAELNLEERAILDGSSDFPVIDKQEDGSLDPGATPNLGDRYILLDVSTAHANFGLISTYCSDGDIVQWDGLSWNRALDVSSEASALVFVAEEGRFYAWNGSTWSEGLAGGIVGSHDPTPKHLPKPVTISVSDPTNPPRVAIGKPVGTQQYYATHNFCDPLTWYSNALKKTNYKLHRYNHPTHGVVYRAHVDENDSTSAPITNWVDLMHGRVTNEESDLRNYHVLVTVDGSPVSLAFPDLSEFTSFGQNAGLDSWGNPLNDYFPWDFEPQDGLLRFVDDPGEATDVHATFHHLNMDLMGSPLFPQSAFRVKVPANMAIVIKEIEVLASKGIEMKQALAFDAYVPNPYYDAGQSMTALNAPYLPLAIATGGQINEAKIFKSFRDVLMESNGNMPVIPGDWAKGTRGVDHDQLQIPWRWAMAKAFKYSDMVEIWVYCRFDEPMQAPGVNNPCVAATFYCESYEESSLQ